MIDSFGVGGRIVAIFCLETEFRSRTYIVPAHRQPAPIINQQARPSVIQFAPSSTPQEHIQIAPQIFVPDVPAGGSNMMSEDEICMATIDEYEKQDCNTG
ncbi:hypothetical protein QTP88_026939 [Uroleucon formosanum]